jgi:hypothetical protein
MTENIIVPFSEERFTSHVQLFPYSCIPSAIEIILKQLGKVDLDYYELQNEWRNKGNGSFQDFDGKVLFGLTFRRLFGRGGEPDFPMEALFSCISQELAQQRFVIISLTSPGGWHMFVIHSQIDDEFVAASKADSANWTVLNVKSMVRQMGGTDILAYSVKS